MTPVLELQNVSVSIQGRDIVRDLSFSCGEGECIAIIGPNGAGKSSLFKTITQEFPGAGSVQLFGQQMDHWSPQEKARQLAILPQSSTLEFPFTVEEVVAMGRLPHDTGCVRDREIVDEVMQSMDVVQLRARDYTQLSGGEKQRTQLARVLAQIWQGSSTRLLLLDEPTLSLDLGHQQSLMKLMRRLCEQGVTVLLILHDINLVTHYCDRILAVKDGCLLADGQTNAVLTRDILQTLYGADLALVEDPTTGKKMVVI